MVTRHLFELVTAALVCLTLPASIEIGLLTVAAIAFRPGRACFSRFSYRLRKLGVVIPAHNEAATIERCLRSLQACATLGPDCEIALVVAADNCLDNTAELARSAGVRTIIRSDTHRRGKGFALRDVLEELLREGFDAFVVIDADSVVEPNLLRAVSSVLEAGADAVQVPYLALERNASMYRKLAGIGLMVANLLRPRGRANLGASAGIVGNGFALSRRTLIEVPYLATSITEDLEYHLALVKKRKRVIFAQGTVVRAEIPSASNAAMVQRVRWEGGRMHLLRKAATSLIAELKRGNLLVLEPLVELFTLPMSYYLVFLLAMLILGGHASRIYALVALLLLIVHVITAIVLAHGDWSDIAALAIVPFYVLWKLTLVQKIFIFSRSDSEWIRTPRTETASNRNAL